MTRWQEVFAQDALLLPLMIDLPSDQVLISKLSEEDYRRASFLDQRIITPQLQRQLASWAELDSLTLRELPKPDYIFHIGHVGSTLISRLLGELPGVLALREPQILRTLCEISQLQGKPNSPWSPETYETRFRQIERWLSRSFHSDQRVSIKASSFVSELAPQLLKSGQHALFLYVPLERYLPTILAGEASIQETQAMAGQRLLRLSRHLGQPPARLWELSLAQRVALSWMCEMTTLELTSKTAESGIIEWLNFDEFLGDAPNNLQKIARHFGYKLDTATAQSLTDGPIMSRYSKAPEHDYSPNLRQQVLAEAQQKAWIGYCSCDRLG